jgi:hypothetical protein
VRAALAFHSRARPAPPRLPLPVCVALAGVVTEYLRFGQAEGGVGDVAQLDRLFAALQVGGPWAGAACFGL